MSIFPTRILLSTDGSEGARLAADTAATLAKGTGSELHMVCVGPGLPLYELPDYPARFEEAVEAQRQGAQAVLDEEVERLENSGTNVAAARLEADERPARAVVRLGEELGAGLLVVGSRGLGGVKRALMGSVSASVVHHAHCPVLVVRGEARGQAHGQAGGQADAFPTKILMATDASEEARLAATTAADMAERTGSELDVVHVGEVRPVYHPEWRGYPARYEDLREKSQRLLEGRVEEIESTGGIVARAHLRMGRPDEEIVLSAEETGADLIVMGSRGLGGIRRALVGSVSDSVVRHADCAVLIVRNTEGRA